LPAPSNIEISPFGLILGAGDVISITFGGAPVTNVSAVKTIAATAGLYSGIKKLEGKIVSKTDYWFVDQLGMIRKVEERYLTAGLMVTRSFELLECQVKLNDLDKRSVKTNAKPLSLK